MNKYTEAIQGDDVVILCDGIPMGVGEILAALNAATPPADAALSEKAESAIRTLERCGYCYYDALAIGHNDWYFRGHAGSSIIRDRLADADARSTFRGGV